MAEPGWDLYKPEIERLYIHENKTRDEVMSFMVTAFSWNKRQVLETHGGSFEPQVPGAFAYANTVGHSTRKSSRSGG